eukprot:7041381-Pyramimonas_sp.AAC.1
MGGGSARELFARSFIKPLEAWNQFLLVGTQAELEVAGGGSDPMMEAATLIDPPIHSEQIDISLRDYADDVSQTLPLPNGGPVRAAERATLSAPTRVRPVGGDGRICSGCT